jgi:hypothetical protein
VLDIMLAAEKAEFFSCPETEANGVVDGELCEGLSNDKIADGARAVVVNARTLLS